MNGNVPLVKRATPSLTITYPTYETQDLDGMPEGPSTYQQRPFFNQGVTPMPTTYLYKVTNLIRDPDGIVVTAQFNITADDGIDSFTHNYSFGFANKPVTPTPFESLTEAKVIEWIKRDAGAENQFEASADAELAAYKVRKAAPTLTAGTPW